MNTVDILRVASVGQDHDDTTAVPHREQIGCTGDTIGYVMPFSRRHLLQAATAAAATGSLIAQPRRRRNVVFILSDDHRYDAMGFMHPQPWLRTPHLDTLARDGAHLKNAFVCTALCSPSRASILTGLYAHRHHIVDNNTAIPRGTPASFHNCCSARAARRRLSGSGTWGTAVTTRSRDSING